MIRSMTGFGEAELEHEGRHYHLEIRSVNHRYFKADIHLPEEFSLFQTDLERLLRQQLTRGSVTLRLHVRDLTATAAAELNTAAIRQYVQQLRTVGADEQHVTIDLATLAALPGVCQPREPDAAQRQRAWEVIKTLTGQAVSRLLQMRTAEGQELAADLSQHCNRIRQYLESIRRRAPQVVIDYRDRLARRIRELIADSSIRVAEEDLLREVAVYAERSDINEECSRLQVHLAQFDRLVAAPEPAGRKLEFLTQEMLREANTIGAKAADAQICRDIIEIKSAIDRLKEQVQNVE
jgi:uncharacterized protein (TIGR00255 family)